MKQTHLLSWPDDLQAAVEAELRSGEEIVWAGQPTPKVHWWMALYLSAWGLFGTVFMVFWITGAAGFRRPWGDPNDSPNPLQIAFACLGLPGLVAALGGLLAPLWLPRQVRKSAERSGYVITNQRALVFDSGYRSGPMGYLTSGLTSLWQRGRKVYIFEPKRLKRIERIDQPDGTGDVILDRHSWRDSDGDKQTTFIGFFAVADIREVSERLNELRGAK